jgi:hypothetical protein
MTELFKTVQTTDDRIIVKAGQSCVSFVGKDSDGDISQIYVSEADAIDLANAILKHFGIGKSDD